MSHMYFPLLIIVIFSNSCSSDNTVTIFENAKDSRSMFKFNSFRFQRLEKVSTVWLHCEVQVCDGERLICQPVSTTLFCSLILLELFLFQHKFLLNRGRNGIVLLKTFLLL